MRTIFNFPFFPFRGKQSQWQQNALRTEACIATNWFCWRASCLSIGEPTRVLVFPSRVSFSRTSADPLLTFSDIRSWQGQWRCWFGVLHLHPRRCSSCIPEWGRENHVELYRIFFSFQLLFHTSLVEWNEWFYRKQKIFMYNIKHQKINLTLSIYSKDIQF